MWLYIKSIVFVLLTCMLISFLAYLYIPKHLGFNPENIRNIKNIDVIFIGPSTTQTSISPLYIWNEYGITSYNLSSSAQHQDISYYLLNKYVPDTTRIIFYDLSILLNENKPDVQNEIFVWYLSLFDRIKYHLENNDAKKFPYYFLVSSYNFFHTRWKQLTQNDFHTKNYYGIRTLNAGPLKYSTQEKLGYYDCNENFKLKDETIEYITRLELFAKKKNIKVIYWIRPFTAKHAHTYKKVIAFQQYAQDNNLNFINFNSENILKSFDYNKDFIDHVHLNIDGGKKISKILIHYIIRNYNIPNHKNDPKYASWNEDYKKYARAINREEIRELKSFNEWEKLAFYDNYTVMMSVNGDILKKLPDTLKNDLKSFGLTKYNTDKPNMRYAAIIDDNTVFFEEISNKPVIYKDRMKNIVNLLIKSDGKSTINVSGKPRSKNKYGLNFVIYDKINREIVDSIWIDPNKPDVVRR